MSRRDEDHEDQVRSVPPIAGSGSKRRRVQDRASISRGGVAQATLDTSALLSGGAVRAAACAAWRRAAGRETRILSGMTERDDLVSDLEDKTLTPDEIDPDELDDEPSEYGDDDQP